jgi:hypothetical protein
MGDWLIAQQFKEIDKGTRSRLLGCLKHKAEIENWRSLLTDAERWKFNHPDTVLKKWKASTVIPDPNAPSKQPATFHEAIKEWLESGDRQRPPPDPTSYPELPAVAAPAPRSDN